MNAPEPGAPPRPAPSGSPRGAGAFTAVALRDLALGALTLVLAVLDARPGASVIVGVAAGVMVPVAAFLAHEWGHWIGAVASGGRVSRPPGLSPYLFFYDTGSSTRRQFLWMSAGGYLATLVVVPPILLWADLGRASGLVAVVLTALGLGITLALEIPTTVRVARGAPLPTGGVYTGSPEST